MTGIITEIAAKCIKCRELFYWSGLSSEKTKDDLYKELLEHVSHDSKCPHEMEMIDE
jgi:hypothetical protein